MTNQKEKVLIKQYLTQYIGQDSQTIQSNFNLKQFNIQLEQNPTISPQRVIYSFKRKVNTLIPSGNAVRDSNGFIIPTQLSSISDSYGIPLTCNIIFNLENNVTRSVSLRGQAC